MNPTILLIDDDRVPMNLYRDAIQEVCGFAVEQKFNPADALAFLEKNHSSVRLIISDIMMKPDIYSAVATEEGFFTGVSLYNEIRNKYPNIPVVILTNMVKRNLQPKLADAKVFEKTDYPPFDFAEIVKELLQCTG